MQGLFEWLYGLFLNCISFTANALLGVMSTDLTFFEKYAPVVVDLYDIFTAVGWALLLGNLVFQALKVMFIGLGFEAESPVSLLTRSAVYGFLLFGSKQICELGLGLGEKIIDLMGIPTFITLTTPDATLFSALGDASWVLVIIIGVILGIQLIKLFFEIGERYVIVCILTLLAPLGFSMSGSKATKDIATGYIRMFASMVIMMILNVLFLKIVLSILATMPTAVTVIPWCILVVAAARTARKLDNLIARIGLNPAITGDPLTHKGGAMALMMLAARSAVKSSAAKMQSGKTGSVSGKSTGFKSNSTGANKPSYNTVNQQNSSSNQSQSQDSANSQSAQTSNSSTQNAVGSQNTRFGSQNSQRSTANNASKNNQTANSSVGNSQTANNGGQKSNLSVNNKTNNGGIGMDNQNGKNGIPSHSPTQVNTNRFGSNNLSSKNSNMTNAADMSKAQNGQINNMANEQKSSMFNNLNMAQNQSAPQTTLNQGKNNIPMNQGNHAQTTGNQGKNNPSTNQNENPQASVHQGKNNLNANQSKIPQASGNQGKNNPSTSHNKTPQTASNQGKNAKAQRIADSLKSGKNNPATVNKSGNQPQGKNNFTANQNKSPQVSGNQVKNTFTQTAQPVKSAQAPVHNGYNENKPVAAQNASETPPDSAVNNEVEFDG